MTKKDQSGPESQLGLSFRPSNMGPDNYPVTFAYWNKFQDDFQCKATSQDSSCIEQDKAVQLVIEAGFHTIGEFEHNTAEDERGRLELEMAVLGIEELVQLVLRRYNKS